MFSTVRFKLSLFFVAAIVAVELFIGAVGIINISNSYYSEFGSAISNVFNDDFKKELTDAANQISQEKSDHVGLVMTDSNSENANDVADLVMQHSQALHLDNSTEFRLLNNSGAVLYSSGINSVTEASPAIDAALAGDEFTNAKKSDDVIDYALPLKSGDTVKYIVYVKDSLVPAHDTVSHLKTYLSITIPISACIAYLISFIASSMIIKPIKRLSYQAKRLADSDNAFIPVSERIDEIGELENSMVYLANSRKEHEDKAASEIIKLEKILQNMTDGILAFDMKGKLTHINPEAQRLLKRNYIDDITFNKFFKEINADITMEDFQFIDNDEFIERELHISDQLLQFNFSPYSSDNNEGGVIVLIHDVTKHERLESARRDFVADVSHELRTPLTVIKSYADILADTPDAEPEVRTRFLNTISSETDRMTKIISDLLTLSKLDENANRSRPKEDIDIRSMLEGLVERLSITAKKKEQTITYTPMNDVPIINGDRGGLERVFTNIISNALKYTSSGGEINVFTSKVYNDILIKVSDNGIGIPKEHLPHIFDRFYRVDKARSRDKGGTGLGLAIAKETIEREFHGKILITSELNKGTDVTISIPAPKK